MCHFSLWAYGAFQKMSKNFKKLCQHSIIKIQDAALLGTFYVKSLAKNAPGDEKPGAEMLKSVKME